MSQQATPRTPESYFLGYQLRWLRDKSPMKIAKKSRRVGWTYVQAYEDMLDAARANDPMDVWFSSADLSAAREYIRYVETWARLFNKAAEFLGEVVIDDDEDIKALTIQFATGKRVYALSSNPKGFRSKGGKVVIDEFAAHTDQDELMQAAGPTTMWGYPLVIFSSPKGKDNRFYALCEEAKNGKTEWSYHEVNLMDAIADGLVEKINKIKNRKATQDEINKFVRRCRAAVPTDEAFEEEYMCQEQDGLEVWIEHGLISAAEDPDLHKPVEVLGKNVNRIHHERYAADEWTLELDERRRYFLGVDIGRHRDITVMWLLEEQGSELVTRLVLELHKVAFRHQYAHLTRLLKHRVIRACCIDRTGIGAQLAEDAASDFGDWRVEGVHFDLDVKAEMSVDLKNAFEDGTLRIPKSDTIAADIRQVKKVAVGDRVKFVGERTNKGHADRYWALALARRAYKSPLGPVEYTTVQRGRFGEDKGLVF